MGVGIWKNILLSNNETGKIAKTVAAEAELNGICE